MRKCLLLGFVLLVAPALSHAAQEGDEKEEGERTFLCWRYERQPERTWVERSISVEAHDAQEALVMCFDRQKAETKRLNKRVVRS